MPSQIIKESMFIGRAERLRELLQKQIDEFSCSQLRAQKTSSA